MRETIHYFHGAQNINMRLLKDDQTGDETLQMIVYFIDGHHSLINVFFSNSANIEHPFLSAKE